MKTINAMLLKNMFIGGAKQLEQKKEWINDLNVFPVPDGDTGNNMSMTMNSAVNELLSVSDDMESVCKAISSGSLRGARGNSGVILSQLLKGFTKTCAEHKEIDIDTLSKAFENAVLTGYKAVLKPKEGTILTVAKAAADEAKNIDYDDIKQYFLSIINASEDMLKRTPDILPILKEAGVVDSGGQGFVEVLNGMYKILCGDTIEISPVAQKQTAIKSTTEEDIKFGYCTEFIIMLNKEFTYNDELEFKKFLESIGDSIVCVSDDNIVKVHVHTNNPGIAIEKALTFGELTNMKIDNMREEHRNNLFQKENNKNKELEEYAIVSISSGEGFKNLFTDLGITKVITGGQTMNPSAEDIANAIKEVYAKTVYVFPNNKNIILAANQAKEIIENESETSVVVIPTKNMSECVSIMVEIMFPDYSEEKAIEIINNLQTCSITHSVRDTNINGIDIKKDDFIAIDNTGIVSSDKTVLQTAEAYIQSKLTKEIELVSIYYGEDSNEEEAQKIKEYIENINDSCEIEIMAGLQPVYNIIISFE